MSDRFSIVTEPTPSLRERSVEVVPATITTPEFQAFLDKLTTTMLVSDGVGIASPQVGRNIRAIVVMMPEGPSCFINPIITKQSDSFTESEEGCLSVPKKFGLVKRHKRIRVEAFNRHGRAVSLDLRNFSATVFQHEIDHLDGILFIDKVIGPLVTAGRHI